MPSVRPSVVNGTASIGRVPGIHSYSIHSTPLHGVYSFTKQTGDEDDESRPVKTRHTHHKRKTSVVCPIKIVSTHNDES
jgi:hypothetical protein